MVHYIRFLKPPKLETKGGSSTIRSLVTVTNDLGDEFFPAELPLHTILLGQGIKFQWRTTVWKPDMRALSIETQWIPPPVLNDDLILLVNSRCSVDGDHLAVESMPEILGARSRIHMPTSLLAVDKTERRFQTSFGCLQIFEETGESIARHIW